MNSLEQMALNYSASNNGNEEWAIFSFHTRARLVIHFEGGLPGNEEKVALSEECIHPIDLTPRTRGVGATSLTCQ